MTTPKQHQWLADWWTEHSDRLLRQTTDRATDYSAMDLDMLGDILTKFASRPTEPASDDDFVSNAELGCWFYLWGKMARALGAICENRAPTDDTVADIEVYALMIQRIRNTGGSWPW